MIYGLSNKYAKNYCNRTILVQIVVKDVVAYFFLRHGVYWLLLQRGLTKRCPVDMSSSGRSGARFLSSYDRRYVVKAMSTDEVTKMNRILKDYHQVIWPSRWELYNRIEWDYRKSGVFTLIFESFKYYYNSFI